MLVRAKNAKDAKEVFQVRPYFPLGVLDAESRLFAFRPGSVAAMIRR
jgi:hypothetical protein